MSERGGNEIAVFGRRAVLEALASRNVEAIGVRVSRRTPSEFRRDLGAVCKHRDITLDVTDDRAVRELSQESRHDQGVAALVRLRNVSGVDEFLDVQKGGASRRRSSVLAVDGITNPQNLGMIVRSAVAAGMTGIVWPTAGCPWINGLVIKASAGTIYNCHIAVCDTTEDAVWRFQAQGYTAFGLEMKGATSLWDLDPPHRGLYIVGSETEGLSRSVRDQLDQPLRIPMAEHVESLNAAIAASLLAFHVGSVTRT